jgi:hypothetical protein
MQDLAFRSITSVAALPAAGSPYDGVILRMGSKVYFCDSTRWIELTGREVCTADRTYYVRSDGSDSNTGLSNTSGAAFLTISKAILTLTTLDGNGFQAFIQVADGTYNESVTLKQCVGFSKITLQGNTATPANCLVAGGSSYAFGNFGAGLFTNTYDIKGFRGTGLYVFALEGAGANITYGNMNFGTVTGSHIFLVDNAEAIAIANYTISGGGDTHWNLQAGGILRCNSITITLTGTPAFAVAFLFQINLSGVTAVGNTFTGSATGIRFNITLNAVCRVGGAGVNYLPGNSAGTNPTGLYS